jgi:hypothetical protein
MPFKRSKMNEKQKHVIFLGAGASATSGYPVGQELRLLMSSKDHFEKEIRKVPPAHEEFQKSWVNHNKCIRHFDDFVEAVKLFRHGGFATVDEFSKLASESYQEYVQDMKRLMRVVLSIHNPEEKFEESDYYPFIQRLFREDNLSFLRNDISIITYNYDCYLDYVLSKAFNHRQSIQKISKTVKETPDVLKGPQPLNELWRDKLTSGFFSPEGISNGTWRPGQFNYFKLHGSIAYANDPYFGHEASFQITREKRFDYLGDKSRQSEVPPVAFPWELFVDNSGGFISEDDFVFVKEPNEAEAKDKGRSLFRHFKTMWENAKKVVAEANKISFIGLSMHEYMEAGLAYLFSGKSGIVQLVVANKGNPEFKGTREYHHASSPCGKVSAVLSKVAPNMRFGTSWSENPGDIMIPGKMTTHDLFKDFLEREM